MVTTSGTTDNLSFSPPTDWPSEESAVETKVSDGTLSTSIRGVPISKGIVGVNRNESSIIEDNEKIFIDNKFEIILFIKKTTSSDSTISSVVKWDEVR